MGTGKFKRVNLQNRRKSTQKDAYIVFNFYVSGRIVYYFWKRGGAFGLKFRHRGN
jgi:hypothetical protein